MRTAQIFERCGSTNIVIVDGEDRTQYGSRPPGAVPVAVLILLLAGCASLGGGDPIVVRGEDVLTNSLTFYDVATDFHAANSTKESPAVYKAMEVFRTTFPKAWSTAQIALKGYKGSRDEAHKLDLTKALDQVETLVKEIKAVWTPQGG